jgi:hypothetical protein
VSHRRAASLPAFALTATLLLAAAGPAWADTPPDTHDPCIAAGRDSCHTAGVGRYATYRYGTRWFGDYRGAVPGVSGPSFCTDLGYWYPSRSYGYQPRSAAGLRNRLGASVPALALNRMAYALWRFGRSNSPDQQAAMMLYVHGLMGDAQPGEVDPAVLGAAVHGVYNQIAAQTVRDAGPYTVDESMPSAVDVSAPVTVSLSVRSASGSDLPGVAFKVSVTGASGPSSVTSNGAGVATLTVTPRQSGRLSVDAAATGLPSDLPQLYVPTSGAAAGSGQRLVVPASQTLTAHATATVSLAHLTLGTAATPASLTLGQTDSDAVTLSGAPTGSRATVTIALYGPASTAAGVSCTAAPAAQATALIGDGSTHGPAFTPPAPGYYGYQLTIAATADSSGVTTPCGGASETFAVFAAPTVHTVVSAATLAAGGTLSDMLTVAGLGDQPATVAASLYGPYAATSKITCTGAPFWTGSVPVQADGQYQTAPVTLTVPGYYVYVESIAAAGFVHAAATRCSDTAETTLVPGAPTVTTQTSGATAAPGSQISDQVVVGGLGALPATVDVALYGPYPSRAAIDCSGTPVSSTTLTAAGDGTYTSAKVTLPAAGYYTFNESIAATSTYPAVATPCAGASETTFVQGTPALATQASSAVVAPGSALSDQITVTGLGSTPAKIAVDLFGPYASLAQVDCSGQPLAVRTLTAPGDGTYRSPAVTVAKAGFYDFREQIAASPLVAAVTTACADTAETSLGAPAIITGGAGPFPRAAAAASGRAASGTPASVQIPSLGVNAPVQPSTIDLADGELAVPADIHLTGWWRDGAAPGDANGTVLIAGHVDSAAGGAGAFYPLKSARTGAIVTVTTRSGAAVRYRVTGVQTVLKANLPIGIFTRTGAPRLVLVTCGGPFDYQTRHYVDNVIVYASPA